MSEPQLREYTTDAGFAWRVVIARNLRSMLTVPAVMLAIVAVSLGLLAIAGASDVLASSWTLLVSLVGVYALLVALGLVISLLSVRKQIPVGSRFTARLSGSTLSFSGPLGTAELAASAYRRVIRRRGFVMLPMRASTTVTILPQQLFVGDELDQLEAAVASGGQGETALAQQPLDNQFVVDERFVGALTATTMRFALTRPALLVVLIILALPAALGLLLLLIAALLGRDPLVALGPIAFSVVVIGLIVLLSQVRIWRTLRAHYPVGSRIELGLTATGVGLRTPRYTVEVPYDRVRGVKHLNSFTVILTRPGQMIIPRPLLPADDEQRLLAALGRQP